MLVVRSLLVVSLLLAPLLAQGGALRGPSTAPAGGTITVQVASNDPSIEVLVVGTGQCQSVPVGPGKTTSVPVPNVPPGSVLLLMVGKPGRRSYLVVEIVNP